MIINGVNIDMDKTASAVAAAYAVISADSSHVPEEGEIDNLLKIYLRTYLDIKSKDPEFLKSLVD